MAQGYLANERGGRHVRLRKKGKAMLLTFKVGRAPSRDERECALVCVPPYHIAGVASVVSNVYAGRRVVLKRSPGCAVLPFGVSRTPARGEG